MKGEKEFLDIAYRVNTVLQENKGKVFTVRELEQVLAGILPTNCLAKGVLVKSEIILRVGRGKYSFPRDPVHWTKIRNFYNTCREKQRTYKKAEDYLYGKPIEVVIRDLKSLGYVILKRM